MKELHIGSNYLIRLRHLKEGRPLLKIKIFKSKFEVKILKNSKKSKFEAFPSKFSKIFKFSSNFSS